MSTVTRTTTPAFSANPFQTFVTYKQARRAAKAGGAVSNSRDAACDSPDQPHLDRHPHRGAVYPRLAYLDETRTFEGGDSLLLALLNLAGAVVQYSIVSLVIMGVTLNFCVIALRGALAMKGLQAQARIQSDLQVF